MDQKELDHIVKKHNELPHNESGKRLDLRWTNLSELDLSEMDLRGVDLHAAWMYRVIVTEQQAVFLAMTQDIDTVDLRIIK